MQSWQTSTRKRRPTGAKGTTSAAISSACLQVVDVGLIGIIFVAPLFLGGREALGKLLFVVLASITGVAWLASQALLEKRPKWAHSWAYVLGLLTMALLVAQILPLPWHVLEQFAPRNVELLPLWQEGSTSPAQQGVWTTLSLTPNSTRHALTLVFAYVALFVATVGRMRTVDDIQQLLRKLAIAAIAMSSFGLIQYFASNGKFFWIYNYPYADTLTRVKGSFTCSNHFVSYLVLCLGPLLAWIVLDEVPNDAPIESPKEAPKPSSGRRSRRSGNVAARPKTALLGLSLLVVVFAIIFSKSRGGAVAFAASTSLIVAIYYFRGFVSGSLLSAFVGIGVIVIGLLSLYGYDEVAGRFDDFAQGSIEDLDHGGGRRKIWAANVAAIRQGGLFGAGAGSHREIYPTYLPESLEVVYTHAENGFLQIATENGWLGVTLLSFALLLVVAWCWRANRATQSKQHLILAGAVTASLAASLVHSLVDFVWYIPACMSVTIILAACGLRLAQLTRESSDIAASQQSSPRWSWAAATAVASVVACWAISTAVGPGTAATHWNKFRLASASGREQSIQSLVQGEPTDDDALRQAESLSEVMIYHLRNALVCDPTSPTAHLRLASKYLQLFEQKQVHSENAMTVSQIREAATNSHFANAKELRDWLQRAFGDDSQLLYRSHYHARRAVQLCPLLGAGYLYLSDLSFLQGQNETAIEAYINQGLRLRPYSFGVIYEVGEQLSALGRDAEAIAHWQRIYRHRGNHQLTIIQVLSRVMPAATFLATFEPDWHTLAHVWQSYRQMGGETDWQQIAQFATQVAHRDCPNQPAKQAVVVWRTLAGMFKELKVLNGTLHCYQQAVQIAPNHYTVRRELGRTLLQLNQFQQAVPHMRWCLARRPHDEALQAELLHASKHQIARDEPIRELSRQ